MTPYKGLLFLPLLLLVLPGCDSYRTVRESRMHMDTLITITASGDRGVDIKSAVTGAFAEIARIEKLLNKYDPASEVSRINRLAAGKQLMLSADTGLVLRKALKIYRDTGGAFDITVSPLVDIWRKYRMLERLPSKAEIDTALSITGSGLIRLDDTGSIVLLRDGVNVDLSGIAKGYAVDRAALFLMGAGVESALIDAGGDIYCIGQKNRGSGWRIGIKHPRGESIIGALTLADTAVATSGDYQRFFMVEGNRYSHIIDPKKGYPAQGAPISVTVIAKDCASADSLATALSAMPSADGLNLINRLEGVEAILISEARDGMRIEMTEGATYLYEKK